MSVEDKNDGRMSSDSISSSPMPSCGLNKESENGSLEMNQNESPTFDMKTKLNCLPDSTKTNNFAASLAGLSAIKNGFKAEMEHKSMLQNMKLMYPRLPYLPPTNMLPNQLPPTTNQMPSPVSSGQTFPNTAPNQTNLRNEEDYCTLCQKHFCNKYYLRKHKQDVHGIQTEPFSLARRREAAQAASAAVNRISGNKTMSQGLPNEAQNNNVSPHSSPKLDSATLNMLKSNSLMANIMFLPSFAAMLASMGIDDPSQLSRLADHTSPKSLSDGSGEEHKQNERISPPPNKKVRDESIYDSHPYNFENDNVKTNLPMVHAEKGASLKKDSSTNLANLDHFKSSMVAAKLADRVKCDLCNKELCNKYFLRTHKIKVHGVPNHETNRTSGSNIPSQFPPISNYNSPQPPIKPINNFPSDETPAVSQSSVDCIEQSILKNSEDIENKPVEDKDFNSSNNNTVTCPLCGVNIGMRICIPAHFYAVHKLSLTDPALYFCMLKANLKNSDIDMKDLSAQFSSDEGKIDKTDSMPNSSGDSLKNLENSDDEVVNDKIKPSPVNNNLNFDESKIKLDLGNHAASPSFADSINGLSKTFQNSMSQMVPFMPPPLGFLPTSMDFNNYTLPNSSTSTPATKWSPMDHFPVMNSTNDDVSAPNPSTSPVNQSGNLSVTSSGSNHASRSPNQMRVLCDICNKWICNKYFLRTHKANKHGINDSHIRGLKRKHSKHHSGDSSTKPPFSSMSMLNQNNMSNSKDSSNRMFPMQSLDGQNNQFRYFPSKSNVTGLPSQYDFKMKMDELHHSPLNLSTKAQFNNLLNAHSMAFPQCDPQQFLLNQLNANRFGPPFGNSQENQKNENYLTRRKANIDPFRRQALKSLQLARRRLYSKKLRSKHHPVKPDSLPHNVTQIDSSEIQKRGRASGSSNDSASSKPVLPLPIDHSDSLQSVKLPCPICWATQKLKLDLSPEELVEHLCLKHEITRPQTVPNDKPLKDISKDSYEDSCKTNNHNDTMSVITNPTTSTTTQIHSKFLQPASSASSSSSSCCLDFDLHHNNNLAMGNFKNNLKIKHALKQTILEKDSHHSTTDSATLANNTNSLISTAQIAPIIDG